MPRYDQILLLDRVCTLLFAIVWAIFLLEPSCSGEEPATSTFERVFGVSGTLDAALVEKVKALPVGERLAVDRDGDGKHDELWFIDNSLRHSAARRPILVCVIDEDGDLDATGPDLDSDLYLADWRADGVIDGVVDYQDDDHDGDVDQMGIFFGEYQKPWLDKNKVQVWWSQDLGDDNLLWYDLDWSYEQNGCQYRSHFSGDEVFYQFSLEQDNNHWLNVFEDPFAFYDPDQDGCSEVVVRICAVGDEVQSLRFSMDVDNDARGRHTHDYEFSISALSEKGNLQTEIEMTKSFDVRGIPVHPVLEWQKAREFARQASWAKAALTWDELNANTEEQVDRDPHERWEGVINRQSENFPQVGGPASSPLNKRIEIALKPALPLRLYYDSTDRRLHLLGANTGWIDIDANLDGIVDARYSYLDSNEDGVFDRRLADLDGDGEVDFDWKMQGTDVQKFNLEFEPLSKFYQNTLEQTLAESQSFIDAANSALGRQSNSHGPAEEFFLTRLAAWAPKSKLGARIRKSPGGARFYLDLIRDRLFLALKKKFADNEKWNKVEGAYQAGEYGAAATNITGLGAKPSGRVPTAFRSYTMRIPVIIDNTGKPQRDDWPVTLSVAEIRMRAPGFEPLGCAVVAPQRWLEWRQIAHQLDQLSEAAGPEISFLTDLPADKLVTYFIYYAPAQAEATAEFADATGTAQDWLPRNIGWESNRGAYRTYGGQIDFFGKDGEQLIFDKFKNDNFKDLDKQNYHEQLAWGIDALQVGKSSGLGGLTLYRDGKAWPVQNPAGEGEVLFSQRTVSQGPIRSVVEITAQHVLPSQPELSVQMLCLIYAEHQETEIRASVVPAEGGLETLTLAPGIVKLSRQQETDSPEAGCYGSWGWQEDAIGEIGLGLIVAPAAVAEVHQHEVQPKLGERQIRCRLSAAGELRYWLIGDWRRGRQYPVAPTAQNWQQQLQKFAAMLLTPPSVTLGDTKNVQ